MNAALCVSRSQNNILLALPHLAVDQATVPLLATLTVRLPPHPLFSLKCPCEVGTCCSLGFEQN
jgi:hypothetical protein